MVVKKVNIFIIAGAILVSFFLSSVASAVSVNVSWSPVTQDINNNSETISAYVLYWGTSSGSYANNLNVGNVTSRQITNISCTPHCYFSVRAVDSYGNVSDYSSEFDFLLPYPDAPTGLSLTVRSSSQIDLSWSDGGNLEQEYRIERSAECSGTYTQIAVRNENVTTYSDLGLSASTEYCYRVRAWNNRGYSAYTPEQSATTDDPVITPPITPSGLSATTISHTQINLSWNDVASEEEYQIQRSLSANTGYSTIATLGINVTSYSDNGLSPSTTYYYRIRATNSAGASAYSSSASARTEDPPPEPPDAPSGLSATAVDYTTVDLAWGDNSDNESSFVLQRRVQGQINFIAIAQPAADSTSYSDITVQSERGYEYRLYATNAVGDSGYSNIASVTTPAAPEGVPSAPSDISISQVDGNTIVVTWRDNSDNETGFKLMRKVGMDGTYTEKADISADLENQTDTDFEPARTYFYMIYAYNNIGQSDPSAEISITTRETSIEYSAEEGPMYSVTGGCGNMEKTNNNSSLFLLLVLISAIAVVCMKNTEN